VTWNSKLSELKDALAGLIADDDSIRTIIRDAGIPLNMVKLNGKAVNTWSDVLDVADSKNKVLNVIRAARKMYAEDPFLQEAEDLFASQNKTTISSLPVSVVPVNSQNYKPQLLNLSIRKKLKIARKLTYRENLALLEVLLACSSMKNLDGRSTILDLLYESVQNKQGRTAFQKLQEKAANTIEDSSASRLHIMDIIKVSIKYHVLGDLIEILRGLEGQASLPMQQVDAYFNKLASQVCTGEQLEKLERIITELDIADAQILRLYRVSVPPDWLPLEEEDELALCPKILDHLAHAPDDEEGIPPLFEFVERLASQKQKMRGKLKQWVDEVARFLGKADLIGSLRAKLADESSHPSLIQPYMMVKLDSDDFEPTKFKLQAWFLYEEWEELELGDKSYTLSGLSEGFERLLQVMQKCSGLWVAEKEPIIEVFLPISLLNYDLNQWTILYSSDETVPINLRYPLVIRSLDRVYSNGYRWKEEMHRLWLAKWHALKEQMASYVPKYCDAVYCNTSFRVRAVDDICLALTFVPTSTPDFNKTHILSTIIQMGIPIALWPRQGASHNAESDFQELFQSILSENGLNTLPESVLTKRKSRLEDSQHPVHYVTLLWDDPTRLPPDVSDEGDLKAPIKVRR